MSAPGGERAARLLIAAAAALLMAQAALAQPITPIADVMVGEPEMTALGVFLTAAAVALGAWSESRSVVYNDATARRRTIARRIATVAGVIAAIAFVVLKVVLPA